MRPRSHSHESAVGIEYSGQEGETPRVGVKGSAGEADEVVRIARRFGVPVVENAALARSLSSLNLDSAIPPSLFKAVAIIISHLDHQKTGP